jgi:endo-1,4-beta-xylanase
MSEPVPRHNRFARLRRPGRVAIWLSAAVVAAVGVVVISTPSNAALRPGAAAHGKFIGFAGNFDLLCNSQTACTSGNSGKPMYRSIAGTEFNQVTPENAMKWENTENTQNQFTFTQGDGIVNFATANNQTVHGHTLVWHQQTPTWVQNLNGTAMLAAMQNHISNVVGHYANNATVTGWDVVNEAFNDDGSRRASFWQNAIGNGYIEQAFRAARQADSNAQLCYNDFSIESVNAKSNAILAMVQDFKSRGVPIDCVGFQSHFILNQIPGDFQTNLQRFINAGVTVRISELDIRMTLPVATNDSRLQQQSTNYASVVNTCLALAGCNGLTIWGIDDGDSWLPNSCCPEGAPLLWDANFAQKPAYTGVANALGGGTMDTTAPSVPGTPTATTTSNSVTLTWAASTDNAGGSGLAGYDIFRAPGASGGTFTSVGTSTTNSFTNTGLTASTTFRYQVRARDVAGNMSAFSAAVTATTQAASTDTTAPSVPGAITTSGLTSTSVNLAWGASTDNTGGSGLAGYDIFRATGATGTFASVGTSTTASFSATGLTANTTYRFEVRARDVAGNLSAFNTPVSITTTGGSTGGSCSATLPVQSAWSGGYVIQAVMTNGTSAITSWTITFTLPAGQTITNSWNVSITVSGTTATARNLSYNGATPANGTQSWGFQASRATSDNSTASGATCTAS